MWNAALDEIPDVQALHILWLPDLSCAGGLRDALSVNFAPGRHEEISIVASSNSIAAAGLALIAPVLIPKPMKDEVSALAQAEFRVAGLDLIGSNDRRLISSAYVGLLVVPFFWGAALWYAHDRTGLHDVSLGGFSMPTPVAIAIGIYLMGMICTELKEKV
jgi:hypothetical protein